MITRNLQNVSKGASNTTKYALFHAHKCNMVIINSIPSSTISLHNTSKLSINPSITHNTKYCFSKTKQSTPKRTAFNIKLSDKDHDIITDMITDSLHPVTQQFILKQLTTTSRQPLEPSSIQPIMNKDELQQDKTYFILSFIQSTPNKSLNEVHKQIESLSPDIVDGFKRCCQASMGANKLYHGWISSTSNTKQVLKHIDNTKKLRPGSAQYYLVPGLKSEHSKPQSIIIGCIDKRYKKYMKTFRDVMVYALSLDANNGGFHSAPKCAAFIETDDIIKEEIDLSSHVIAKSVSPLESYQVDEIPKLEYRELQKLCKPHHIKANSKQNIMVKELQQKCKEIQNQSEYINEDLMAKVRQVQIEVGEEAHKQQYRAEKLKGWHDSLEEKEQVTEKEKEATKKKNDEMNQKEHDLLNIRENVKWNSLRNKRNAAEIENKKQCLFIMEHKLNEEYTSQKYWKEELNEMQKVLDDKDIELKRESQSISARKLRIDEREQQINEETITLSADKIKYFEEYKLLQEAQRDITEREDQIKVDRKHISVERESLRNDEADWSKKSCMFIQRDQELSKKENKYQQDIVAFTLIEEKMKQDTQNIKNERDIHIGKANELNSMEQQLKVRETQLSGREHQLYSEQQTLQQQEQEYASLANELKEKQNRYDIQIKKLNQDQQRLKEDKRRFEIDQRALKEKQTLYEENKVQFDKEQKVLDDKEKYMEKKEFEMDQTKKELVFLQATLEQKTEELTKDNTELQENKDLLLEQTVMLKESKERAQAQKQDIDKRFVELNAARNEYWNDKIKTQQLQNELKAKQKELDINAKQNQNKEQDIAQRYKKMNKEEQEIMRKIEPIKEKEKELNERQSILEKKERVNVEQQTQLFIQNKNNTETQQTLKIEKRQLKDEEKRLQMLAKQLETKHDKISQHDKRIVLKYDAFNKEKYEIQKLNSTLTAKETEIAQREQKLEIQQKNIDEIQMKTDEEAQHISKRKEELEIMQNSFQTKYEAFEVKQKELQEKSEKYTLHQMELDKAKKAYSEQRKQLEEERTKIESDRNLMTQQNDYIKQQNQALNAQKKLLDAEKIKIDSKALLLATRTQQITNEKEAQNVIQSKLEKIKSDLQSAQQRHKEEDEKLRKWSGDLQYEQNRLDEKAKDMEHISFALSKKEVELQKQQIQLEREQIPKETLEQQEKAIKEKEEWISITLSDVKQQEKKLLNEERRVNAALKEADDAKYALNTQIIRKETELSTKETALRDRDITISKQERKIKDKETELRQTEDKMHRKETELSMLLRDMDIQREQISREMKKKTYEIQSEKIHIEEEKYKLEQQNIMESEREEEINKQIKELQNELHRMETNTLQQTQKIQKLSEENSVLYMDKQMLQQKIVHSEQKEKERKRPMDEWKRHLKQQEIENENEQRKVKHLMSTLKRREHLIESKENQLNKQQQRMTAQQNEQQQQQHGLRTLMLNLQKQLSFTEQTQNDATKAKQIHDAKTKLVTGLQTNLKRVQESSGHKDELIYRLQNELMELRAQSDTQKISVEKQHIVSEKPEDIVSVPLNVADPTRVTSKRNEAKINYIIPSSIETNDPFSTSETVVPVPHPIDSTMVVADSLPPSDTIYTANIASIPLSIAQPISVISNRNIRKPEYILPSSISINDPYITSHPIQSGVTSVESLPPNDIIATANVPSIDLYKAEPTSVISRRNIPKPNYIVPASTPINDWQITSHKVESLASKGVALPTHVSFCVAQPISIVSNRNRPKLPWYNIASSIPVTSIIEATDNVLYHPSAQTVIDTAKFVEGLRGLKELQDGQEPEQVEPAKDYGPGLEEPEITDFSEAEHELKSNLNATDLDTLFQCSTNPDLLFDDIDHLETIFLGLDCELQDYLSECRDYKSITNPLPSTFKSNIADLNSYEKEVFDGDVICCLEWKFDNNSFESIVDDIQHLMTACNEGIHKNREMMEQYTIAMNDDKTRSISNRNKLRQINARKENKMSIYNINTNSVEFKNDLSIELLELQYVNSEWLLLRSTLNQWTEYIQKAIDNDRAAFNGSDALYLRAFCILPSQPQNVRKQCHLQLQKHLERRKWVEEINALLSIKNDFGIFYGEMGPDVSNWEDKLLIRDQTSYVLNGTSFELHSTTSSSLPLSEGFVRIGFQAQLLIESAQSLLGHMDPYIERIITIVKNWCNRDDHVRSELHNVSNLESSLKNGEELVNIEPLTLQDKTPLQRAKLLKKDEKYVSLFRDPLSSDLDELLQDIDSRKMDANYMKKLHTFLAQYFEKLYRDKLMLPTPNSAIIEETAPETWQKHALLAEVFSDEFGKILQLLSNESFGRQICHFASDNVYDLQQQQKQTKQEQMFYELFLPFETFSQYHTLSIKQKLYEIVSDFDIQQYLSDNLYRHALKKKLNESNKRSEWRTMQYTDKSLAPQQFVRDEAVAINAPSFTFEEMLATHWTGYLKGILNNVPVEKPLRLPQHYHDIELNQHLKQHYYLDSYKPPSHEDVAARISIEDKMNGVDIYRDKYIQRPHQSKRILQTQLKFIYHNKSDYMRGAFPLENFNYLPYGTKKPIKHRVTVRKSPFVHARAQENYETRIYTKVATNYKLTSNRTADMFNARGFDLLYDSIRVM